MKLLILASDRYPPFRVDVKVLFAEELASNDFEIDWILQSDRPLKTSQIKPYGSGRVWIGPVTGGASALAKAVRLLQGFLNDFKVFRLSRNGDYDAIQVKDKFLGAIFGLIAAKLTNTKFVYWLSYPFPEAQKYTAQNKLARYPTINRFRGIVFDVLLYRIILPKCDIAFVQSDQMKKDIVQRGINASKLVPIPMGVTQSLLDSKSESGLADEPTVAYLGTMIPVRRLDFVIRAFAKVLASKPDAKLLMIGGPESDLQLLKQEACRLNITNRIVFTGNLPQPEALRLIASAHVCLSPFFPTPILNSTSPTKLIEYMALGKPVVANHHPEQTRILNESNAGICVNYKESEFADAVLKILDNPCLAEEMGKNGRVYAEKRSYSQIATVVKTQYLHLLSSQNA